MVSAVAAFAHGRAAELAAPDDERGIEQSAALEVLDQARDGCIALGAEFGVVILSLAERSPAGRAFGS